MRVVGSRGLEWVSSPGRCVSPPRASRVWMSWSKRVIKVISCAVKKESQNGVSNLEFWEEEEEEVKNVSPGKMTSNKAIRDFKRRQCVAKYEVKRKEYKAMRDDVTLPFKMRRQFDCKLQSLPRNSCPSRLRNRCFITGRPRAVYRMFRLSRLCLREMAHLALLPGLHKASW